MWKRLLTCCIRSSASAEIVVCTHPDKYPTVQNAIHRNNTALQQTSIQRENIDSISTSLGTKLNRNREVEMFQIAEKQNSDSALPKNHIANVIDERDLRTPDNWLMRNPDLIRLTGNHPLNCEPDLSALLKQGFITPISLHYVRNHGKVPRCDWRSHTLTINGMVSSPMKFSMDEIVQLPSITMPVQLVCAGNRRKEVNLRKQTSGFNWGYAAHACSLWTGVKLSHILSLCGVDIERARYIHLTGSKLEELPMGTFSTDIDIKTALDPWGDVLIAYKQNGEYLTPDHGYPLRVVVPGFIGGRTIKWLEEITVSELPSKNYYHFHDNRILPPHVDSELAEQENWLSRPEYLFNEGQVNSAIVFPKNGELIGISEPETVKLKGFAISGGGRKINRVEVSMNGGKQWNLCKLSFPEEEYSHAPKYGKYYCWMFWEYEVNSSELLLCSGGENGIRCRAWDVSNNTQPSTFEWNLFGMGNNSHYTIKFFPKQVGKKLYIQCLHPAAAGSSALGWITHKPPLERTHRHPVDDESLLKNVGEIRAFSTQEVEQHSAEESLWVIIEGKIYDVTKYINEHPGGAATILKYGGKDATEDFLSIHSPHAKEILKSFLVGDVIEEIKSEVSPQSITKGISKSKDYGSHVALDPDAWKPFQLTEVKNISENSKTFQFQLLESHGLLGINPGQHLAVKALVDNESVVRSYTPISSLHCAGYFTLAVKLYLPGINSTHSKGGKMSRYFNDLRAGDNVMMSGPKGNIEYKGSGIFSIKGRTSYYSKIIFICGGSGITPAYQIIQAIHNNLEDDINVWLIYANKTETDIWMRSQLDTMGKRKNINIWYTIEDAKEDWDYSTGYITDKMMRERIPLPSDETFIGICGPLGFIKNTCIPNLQILGYSENSYCIF